MNPVVNLSGLKDWPKKITSFVWRREAIWCILIAATVLLLFIGLSRIPADSAAAEQATASASSSIKEIFDNPINAPYKLASLTFINLNPSIIMLRAISFTVFVLTCISLYYVLRHWHTQRAAVLTTIAFATNSIVLTTARLGTPLVALFSWFLFSSLLLWQLHSKSNKLVPILTMIGLGFLLYTPGAPWFFAIMLLVYFSRFKHLFRDVKPRAIIIGGFLSFLVLLPLVISFARQPELLREWLLLPESLVWSDVPRSILEVPSAFIYRMPEMPIINIARLPVFDLVGGMLFLIGLNAYRKKVSLDRTKLMVGTVLAGIIIGALGQTLTAVIILLPFAFSVIAAGIEYLMDEWQGVFPRNPFAKSFGAILLSVVVIFGAYYHLTRFLVVWPQTLETKTVYNQSRVIEQ